MVNLFFTDRADPVEREYNKRHAGVTETASRGEQKTEECPGERGI